MTNAIAAANNVRNIANLAEIVPVGSEWVNRESGETVTVTRVATMWDEQGVWVQGRKTGYESRPFLNSHRPA